MPEEAWREIKDRYRKIVTGETGPDEQEMAEREEAAAAYSKEQERHFVDYVQDCINTSYEANKDIRQVQNDCWRVFQEKEPESYGFKEEWQSRVKIPKPYSSVMFGAAAVQKAFSPDFLTIEKENDEYAEKFWKSTLDTQLDNRHADFVTRYVDATIMALAVGQSSEIIPRFDANSGLMLDLVEPWKIDRDPDAPPRDPQGGLYWIHKEWLDYHVLLAGEQSGKYHDVSRVKDVRENSDNPMMTKEAIARRKNQIWSRSKFRKMILTSEFWGTVLAPNGEELIPSGTMTVAGDRLIEIPRKSPYNRLRWPGVSFSAMPDLLTYGGRGLLEGIITLWESMCNIMCLHEDALKYIVNPPSEINVDNLVDPTDVDDWPGKKYLSRQSMHGQQTVRSIDRPDATNSVLANLQYHDQIFQRGSMVTDAVQGLPGYRAEVTAHEAAQNLDQSMGVFGLMGNNLEAGAIAALDMVVDVLGSFASIEDLWPGVPNELKAAIMQQGAQMPPLRGNFSISGMQELMQRADTLRYLTTTVFPMAQSQTWAPFINRRNALKAFEERTNLKDEEIFITEKQANQVVEKQPMGQPEEAARSAAGGGQQPPRPDANKEKRGPKVPQE